MRKKYDNLVEVADRDAYRKNRNFVEQKMYRNLSADAMSPDSFRNGAQDFGALQVMNVIPASNFAVFGTTGGSTVVGI